MSLNIGTSTSGVDQNGMIELISRVKIDAIEPTKDDLRIHANKVRDAVDTVWTGKSAEAFKNKITRDTESICNALDELGEGVEGSLNNVASNVEEYDEEIAQKLDKE